MIRNCLLGDIKLKIDCVVVDITTNIIRIIGEVYIENIIETLHNLHKNYDNIDFIPYNDDETDMMYNTHLLHSIQNSIGISPDYYLSYSIYTNNFTLASSSSLISLKYKKDINPLNSSIDNFLNDSLSNVGKIGHIGDTKSIFNIMTLLTVTRSMDLRNFLSKIPGVIYVYVMILTCKIEIIHNSNIVSWRNLQIAIEGYDLKITNIYTNNSFLSNRIRLIFKILPPIEYFVSSNMMKNAVYIIDFLK